MVTASTIIRSNAQFATQGHGGVVCVFAGATSGIGAQTLERMVTMFRSATFYVLGRSTARFESQKSRLDSLANPGCKIIFVEADVSLLSDIDDASQRISAAEDKVDYLCMSMGGIPLNGAECAFGITLSLTSPILLTLCLYPLLRYQGGPRSLFCHLVLHQNAPPFQPAAIASSIASAPCP